MKCLMTWHNFSILFGYFVQIAENEAYVRVSCKHKQTHKGIGTSADRGAGTATGTPAHVGCGRKKS